MKFLNIFSNIASPVVFFFFITMLYLILSLFGYGSDNDTYGLIHSGQNLILNGKYVPSRFQGALIPEIAIGASSLLGGYFLSNLLSVILSILSLYFFYNFLLSITSKEKSILIVALVGLNPHYIIASTTSMDYVYSIFFILLGFTLLQKKRFFIASLFVAFAISSRLSNSLIVLVMYFYFIYIAFFCEKNKKEALKYFLSGVLGIFYILILFLPVFVASDYTFNFLTYGIGNWDLFGYISRFIYKNISLYGVVPFLLLLFIVFANIKKLIFNVQLAFALLVLTAQELLFAKIPLEISYLLPLIFVVFTIVGLYAEKKHIVLLIFVILINNFITIDILRIEYDTKSSGVSAIDAKVGFFVKQGIIFEDLTKRKAAYAKYGDRILSEQ